MLLNKAEFALMNNPIREFIQENIEIKNIQKLCNVPAGKTVLEIGCGNGNGAKLIKKYFHPEKIYGVDLDEKMIDIANRKNRDASVSFEPEDAAKLRFRSNFFDSVFDFGIIHHIPNWKDCLKELKRVLKPSGILIIEDLSLESFSGFPGGIYKMILDHPYKNMFTKEEFSNYLEKLGFKIIAEKRFNPLRLMRYFVIIAKK